MPEVWIDSASHDTEQRGRLQAAFSFLSPLCDETDNAGVPALTVSINDCSDTEAGTYTGSEVKYLLSLQHGGASFIMLSYAVLFRSQPRATLPEGGRHL